MMIQKKPKWYECNYIQRVGLNSKNSKNWKVLGYEDSEMLITVILKEYAKINTKRAGVDPIEQAMLDCYDRIVELEKEVQRLTGCLTDSQKELRMKDITISHIRDQMTAAITAKDKKIKELCGKIKDKESECRRLSRIIEMIRH